MKRICLITCYMGPLPVYFDYFVASCKKNQTVDFLVINDTFNKSSCDENVSFVKMNLNELNSFVSQKLAMEVKLASAWKINELKPLFGNIFAQELKTYDYWGWCDLDIIWGRLRHFLDEASLSEFDVITSKQHWTAGHFTLFRNNELCNNLYKRYDRVIDLLNDPTYYAFEESCHRWNGVIFDFEELAAKKLPISMFDLVKRAEANGELKARFTDVIREHPQAINYRYQDGRLIDLGNGEEFMYYHLITVKKIWRFYIPPYRKEWTELSASPFGIRADKDPLAWWFVKRARACVTGIRKSAAKQSSAELIKKLIGIRSVKYS